MRGHRGGGLLSVALGVGVVFASVAGIGIAAGVGATAGAGASTPAPGPRVALPQAVPHIPADATQLGAAPSGQVLKLDVALAGQDPAALAQAVAAVSTPGSPDYRHYVTPAQFTASYGPSPAEVDQVTSVLRSDGLDVGDLQPDSNLLPVTGTASAVAAAFGTSLETVQVPDQARAVVNTSTLGVPASLSGVVSGVVGLNGVFDEHSMLKRSPVPAGSRRASFVGHLGLLGHGLGLGLKLLGPRPGRPEPRQHARRHRSRARRPKSRTPKHPRPAPPPRTPR